jgi:hypothetical protein
MGFDECGATGDVTLTGWFEKFDQPPFIGFHVIHPTGCGILYQFAPSADVSWTGKVQLGAYGGGLWSYVRGNVQRAPNGAFVFGMSQTDGSRFLFLVAPAKELVKKSTDGWISAVRPSRRPLRSLLRMTDFLNAINDIPHGEERQGRVSNHAPRGCETGGPGLLVSRARNPLNKSGSHPPP